MTDLDTRIAELSRAVPAAGGGDPAGVHPHSRRLRRPARRRRRRPAVRSEQPRGAAARVPPPQDRRDRRGAQRPTTSGSTTSATSCGRCRTPATASPRPTSGSSTSTATPTRCRRCAAVAREDRRHRHLRRPGRRDDDEPRLPAPRAGPPAARRRVGPPALRPRLGRPAGRRGRRGGGDQDRCSSSRREGALHGVIIRAYATAAEEDNDGGGPHVPHDARCCPARRPSWCPTW